jgi:hypothetical protein
VRSLKRRDLELRAKQELEQRGYTVARATISTRFIKNMYITNYNDFFNSFDLIAARNDEVRFIQVTSGTQLSPHKRKVLQNFPYSFKCGVSVEIWYYYKLGRKWEKTISLLKDGKWIESHL